LEFHGWDVENERTSTNSVGYKYTEKGTVTATQELPTDVGTFAKYGYVCALEADG
jgi:hypothetical protein